VTGVPLAKRQIMRLRVLFPTVVVLSCLAIVAGLHVEDAGAYLALAKAWEEAGEYDRAITNCRQAVAIAPDDWDARNTLAICLWKQGQVQDQKAAKAAADGNQKAADAYHLKAAALKNDAQAQWLHGTTPRPTATDITGSGRPYSEYSELDSAERKLKEALKRNPRSPRAHNNLGRVLLRRFWAHEAEAREIEQKAKTDPAVAAKVKQLKKEAKENLDAAIAQFEKAVELDPSFLEARLNLGEVYLYLNQIDKSEKDLDKSEYEYRAILKLDSISVKDQETINNFGQAWFSLARIALMRNKPDEAIEFLRQALIKNPQNQAAMNLLALQLLQQGDCREAEKVLWPLLAQQPKKQRLEFGKQFIHQLEVGGKTKDVLEICNFMAGPSPRARNRAFAMAKARCPWPKLRWE
jgi:tetratricopeptide (TPR) repeat protein